MTKQQRAALAEFFATPKPKDREPLILGVDPGAQGAIAWVRPRPNTACVTDLPQTKIATATKAITVPDVRVLDQALAGTAFRGYAFVEMAPSYKPGPAAKTLGGAAATGYKIAAGFFPLWAFFTLRGFVFEKKRPDVWKRGMGLDKDKAKSVARAVDYFPDFAAEIGKNDNRAEAFLLAHFARFHVWPGL